jgi:hypothetical protein
MHSNRTKYSYIIYYGSLIEIVRSRFIVFNALEHVIEYKTTPPYILIQKSKVLLYIEYQIKEVVLHASSVNNMYHNTDDNQKGSQLDI